MVFVVVDIADDVHLSVVLLRWIYVIFVAMIVAIVVGRSGNAAANVLVVACFVLVLGGADVFY